MKKVLAIAVALTMTVAVGTASAHHGRHHHRWHHHHGFVVAGTGASFNGTKDADGTYTGDLTLTLKHHGDKVSAHKSNGTDATKTFHLDGTAVKFADSVTDANGDGTVDFSDVQPTDVVVLKVFGGHHRSRSHGAKAHKSCHNGDNSDQGSGTSDNSSTPTIKKAFVFRPQQQEAEPAPQQ
ncbi:MAG TPA: hypothetical protein VH817_08255 [Thermoleophilaceae bacterium]|jgi:hypothetical protein